MIDKSSLLEWLSELGKNLDKRIILVAVGGTAMTLLGLKPTTRDIDFCIASKDEKEFKKALDKKFIVHVFTDGYIFSEQLPSDYVSMSKSIAKLKNIDLKALNPIDIIITKAARLNARDEEDIEALAKHAKKEDIIKRFKEVVKTYAGDENLYRDNFNHIIKRFF